MNKRKRKKIEKADKLFSHNENYTYKEIMQSYYWWLHYIKRREWKLKKEFKLFMK